MIFSLNSEVIYNQMLGKIVFICENYLVVEFSAVDNRKAPKLLVFRENFKNIQLIKESLK